MSLHTDVTAHEKRSGGAHLSLFSLTSNVRDRDRAQVLKRFEGENASFLVQLKSTMGLEPTDMAMIQQRGRGWM